LVAVMKTLIGPSASAPKSTLSRSTCSSGLPPKLGTS